MNSISWLESCYSDLRVLVTGHNGFKGSWLSLWLARLGAVVAGYSLPPDDDRNHFSRLSLDMQTVHGDINDVSRLSKLFESFRPHIVFHLAAQPIVNAAYKDPLYTINTNVSGTAAVLECCRNTPEIKGIVVITSDKCYENREWCWGYRENDMLGGYDPYSVSKACAEMICSCYRNSFFNGPNPILIATCRSGNVAGGGDWSPDRLVPDVMISTVEKKPAIIRNPQAIRPWLHVLEPLYGYLAIGAHLYNGHSDYAGPWNFGPSCEHIASVIDVVQILQRHWPLVEYVIDDKSGQYHEADFLTLDSSKARHSLHWRPIWNFETTFSFTAEWYRRYHDTGLVISEDHLDLYLKELSA